MTDAVVIGAGPAGLMAAQTLSCAGLSVLVADAKPSIGRKFLMAGKSGLNLTKEEPFETFLGAYGRDSERLRPILESFGPVQVREWAAGLKQDLFTGSTGRVFPTSMKASPLLRAWLGRLANAGVRVQTRWHWQGWDGEELLFDTPDGPERIVPLVTVLACGGASWARLGSDGAWMRTLHKDEVRAFEPSNMGFAVAWSDHMQRHIGSPVKGIALSAGQTTSRGEIVISATGIEGGGIYAVSQAMREGNMLTVDLMPDLTVEQIRARLDRPRGKASLTNHLRKVLKFDPAKQALLLEFARPLQADLAPVIKSLTIRHRGPHPIDQAISTAGGLRFDAMDENLMLISRPGTFAAGEMLDWEAPTGGYLITACLAMGHWAGRAAARHAA